MQGRADLTSGSWSATGTPVQGTGAAVSIDVPATGESLFLRVTVQ
ncbi:MAG: hypothetical protein ACKPGK_14435 [Verrucomicrobiota bacterium]